MTDTINFKAPHLTEAQKDKFVSHNEGMDLLDAALGEASPFAPDNVQNLDANGVLSGLTFGYLGGRIRNDNVITTVARDTILLTASDTNYVEVDTAGTVTVNQAGFTSGRFPLHEITTDATDMTAITDKRAWFNVSSGGGGEIAALTEKVTPVAGDWVLLEDSADSNNKKKAQVGNLPGGSGGTDTTVSSFKAYRNTTQSITANTWTKVQLNTEVWDVNSTFDSTTNYRHTPTTAGKYLYVASWLFETPADQGRVFVALYFNGSIVKNDTVSCSGTGNVQITSTAPIEMNGTTDYVEAYAYRTNTGNIGSPTGGTTSEAACSLTCFYMGYNNDFI